MSHAKELINAIQSCQLERLRQVIARLQQLAQQDAQAHPHRTPRNRLNDTLGGPMHLTALHVAARAYAAHAPVNAHLAGVFDQMVGDLLAAGADPLLEIGAEVGRRLVGQRVLMGVVRPGLTVAEVCERRVPPSLAAWFADIRNGGNGNTGGRTEEQREALSERAKQIWAQRRAEAEALEA